MCVLVLTEVGGISELTEACDWWSYGSLLYELLTGMVSSWAGRVWSPGGTFGFKMSRGLASQGQNRLPGSPCLTTGPDVFPPIRPLAIEFLLHEGL